MVLDLTPNYLGATPWFTNTDDIIEKLKVSQFIESVHLCCILNLASASEILLLSSRLQQSTGWVRVWTASRYPASKLPLTSLTGQS